MPRTLVALVVLAALIMPGCVAKPAAPPAVQPQAADAPSAAPAPPPPAPAPSPPVQPPPPSAPPAAAPSTAAPATPSPAPARPPVSAAVPAPAAPATAAARKAVYVKVSQANFREAGGTSGKILRVLRRGARLEVLETRSDWLRGRLDDGLEGWVAESVTSDSAP